MSGFVVLGVDVTGAIANFVLLENSTIYGFESSSDAMISNSNDNASILKLANSDSYNKIRLINKFNSQIKVFLSIHMSGK